MATNGYRRVHAPAPSDQLAFIYDDSYQEAVQDFHRKFDLPHEVIEVKTGGGWFYELEVEPLTPDILAFRSGFLLEELRETIKAVQDADLPSFADGLVDLVYVIEGTALFNQVPLDDLRHAKAQIEGEPFAPRGYVEAVARYRGELFFHYATTGTLGAAPALPDPMKTLSALAEIGRHLLNAIDAFADGSALNAGLKLVQAEQHIYRLAIEANLPFDLLFDEVQRANITKVRASSVETSASGSGRGHGSDVIKPPGWVGPDVEGILLDAAARALR